MSKVWINKSTLKDIANAIRSKKGSSALIDPSNFAREIQGISGGGGSSIANSFTVNFYDYDKALLESHTAKCGYLVGSPLSFTAGRWQDADEYVYSFPITLDIAGSVINLYAIEETLVDQLYYFYCIDKETYPLVFINIIQGSYWEIFLYFGKTFTSNGDNIITMTDVVGYKLSTTSDVITPIYENRDDVSFVVESVFDNIAVSNLKTGATAQGKSAETANFALYTNFDTDLTRNTDSIYRLDA